MDQKGNWKTGSQVHVWVFSFSKSAQVLVHPDVYRGTQAHLVVS